MLQYSELTKSVYFVDSKGKKHDVSKDFYNMIILSITDGKEIPELNNHVSKLIGINDMHGKQMAAFEIQLTRIL